MFDRMFANYLVKCNKLSEEDLTAIFSSQEQKRVRLGVIAVSEKLMTIEQVEEVNQLQAILDKRFGDIAVEKGYLTDEQVGRLLVLQGNAYLAFVQSAVDGGFITMEEIENSLVQFQKDNSYTASNMDALKSCDIDRIIDMFVYEQPEIIKSLAGVMVRTVSRLVDYHTYIAAPTVITEYNYPAICSQTVIGDYWVMTALAGDLNTALFDCAAGFAGKDIVTSPEDAADALCELVNCVNGLLASDYSSKNIDIDMEAPFAKTDAGTLKASKMLCLPMIVFGKQVDLIIVFSNDYSL